MGRLPNAIKRSAKIIKEKHEKLSYTKKRIWWQRFRPQTSSILAPPILSVWLQLPLYFDFSLTLQIRRKCEQILRNYSRAKHY